MSLAGNCRPLRSKARPLTPCSRTRMAEISPSIFSPAYERSGIDVRAHAVDDLLGRAQASDRLAAHKPGFGRGGSARGIDRPAQQQRHTHRAGMDRVGLDAFACMRERSTSGEQTNRALSGAGGGVAVRADDAVDRRDVNDRPAPAFAHLRDRVTGGEEHALAFTAMMRSHASAVVSSPRLGCSTAASLTSTASGPNALTGGRPSRTRPHRPTHRSARIRPSAPRSGWLALPRGRDTLRLFSALRRRADGQSFCAYWNCGIGNPSCLSMVAESQ